MKKNTEYYMSKGLDRPMADYFASGRKKIVSVVPNKNFTLTLEFDNGEKRLLDCMPFLKNGTVFEKIKNYDDFKRVYLDSTHCVSWDIDPNIDSETLWSNKIDLCPDSCYVDSVPLQ